jgi:ABC-2 type transport system permease protein
MTVRSQPALRFVRKHLAIARIALQQSLRARGALLGRVGFYAVILLVFSRLWEVIGRSGALGQTDPVGLLWYLALTEWILLSVPALHLEIEADVRSGEIAYQLPRPVSYLTSTLARSMGELVARLVLLAAAGGALAWMLSGALPVDPTGVLCALPIGALAATALLGFHAIIGLGAFWLQDCSPLYWVWQKAAFVLGGLMLPLDIYPEWLRRLAELSPFAALIYAPASLAFDFDVERALRVAGVATLWTLVCAGLLTALYGRALRVLDLNGG